MPCIPIKFPDGMSGILTVGNPPIRIIARGKEFRFEMHDYCGPMMVSKRGDPLKVEPKEKSPFWIAVTAWDRQGRRMDGDMCIWDAPKPTKVKHLGGKHYAVVEYGDEWFDGIEIVK